MNKTQIKAEIVADSLSPQGERLTSLLITFPRIILAEVLTHRLLSRNTSSSRAIPFKKMVESVQNDPFVPIAWQKHHSGMQGSEYLEPPFHEDGVLLWIEARDSAIKQAQELYGYGITKQLANRLLEPFMWTTMLITGSKKGWDNFFELRNPVYEYLLGAEIYNFKSWKELISFIKTSTDNKDYIDSWENETILGKLQHNKGQAEIHIMDLSEKIYNAIQESTPKQLEKDQWHIPFEDKINELYPNITLEDKIKVSVGMAANTSYTVVGDGSIITVEKATRIHDKCKELSHSSVFEHCAKAMSDKEYQSFIKGKGIPDYNLGISSSNPVLTFREDEKGWCRNFKGFLSYRSILEDEK